MLTTAVKPVEDWMALVSASSIYGEPHTIPSIRSLAACQLDNGYHRGPHAE